MRLREPTLETEGWATHKNEQQIPRPIRKRRGYHPNTRKIGVYWGPWCWVRDDTERETGAEAEGERVLFAGTLRAPRSS